MKKTHARWNWIVAAALLAGSMAGCGGNSETVTDGGGSAGNDGRSLPTASISPAEKTESADTEEAQQPAGPEKGSTEWLLEEILRERRAPFPGSVDRPGEIDLDKLAAAQEARNRKIIELAGQVVARTHKDESRQEAFAAAIHHLMEARMQLALGGDRESIDALYDDAASLYDRDPKSASAAHAAYAVARFAHTNALRFGAEDSQWLQEFTRQAKHYATGFPQDVGRGASLLLAAAQSCEVHDLRDDALTTYALLQRTFPETPQAEQAAAVMRRLTLVGKPLELVGPTIDGGRVDVQNYRGRGVLVVFWSTTAGPFVEHAARVQETLDRFPAEELAVVGVNLDEDEAAVDAFLEQHRLPWRHIFHAEPELRSWNNPVARQYGIREIPQYWLADRQGIVVDTSISPETLEATLTETLKAPPASGE